MDRTAEYIEIERKVHPWASDDILQKIVEDELKANPNYYEIEKEATEEEEEPSEKPGVTITIGHSAKKGPTADPFPKEEDEE